MPSTQQARGSYFLSTFISAFRQVPERSNSTSPIASQTGSKHTSTTNPTTQASSSSSSSRQAPQPHRQPASVTAQVALHSSTARAGTRNAVPIPGGGRRRGSESSSEGFREVNPVGGPWYIGGRNAAGEEKFFKLGVVRRVRSIDGLSLDRLSL